MKAVALNNILGLLFCYVGYGMQIAFISEEVLALRHLNTVMMLL
jgi:hypothetical protein